MDSDEYTIYQGEATCQTCGFTGDYFFKMPDDENADSVIRGRFPVMAFRMLGDRAPKPDKCWECWTREAVEPEGEWWQTTLFAQLARRFGIVTASSMDAKVGKRNRVTIQHFFRAASDPTEFLVLVKKPRRIVNGRYEWQMEPSEQESDYKAVAFVVEIEGQPVRFYLYPARVGDNIVSARMDGNQVLWSDELYGTAAFLEWEQIADILRDIYVKLFGYPVDSWFNNELRDFILWERTAEEIKTMPHNCSAKDLLEWVKRYKWKRRYINVVIEDLEDRILGGYPYPVNVEVE